MSTAATPTTMARPRRHDVTTALARVVVLMMMGSTTGPNPGFGQAEV